jgi:hypothetical protein
MLWMDEWVDVGWGRWGLMRVISLRTMGALWVVTCLHRVVWDRMELMKKAEAEAGGG